MKLLDVARETAGTVSGAMRVAVISCVLSILAILITLAVALAHLRSPSGSEAGA
jgi:hypothetical protein